MLLGAVYAMRYVKNKSALTAFFISWMQFPLSPAKSKQNKNPIPRTIFQPQALQLKQTLQ